MADSAIEWTRGADGSRGKTWNPTVGCDKVSAGCTHCYAMTLAHRLEAMGQKPYAGLTRKLPDGSVNWTGVVRALPERLALPLKWRKPARIFVDSMSDLFHEDVPDEFILQVFAVMAQSITWGSGQRHTYQILTKRPARMASFVQRLRWRWGVVDGGPWRLPALGDRPLNPIPVLDDWGSADPPLNVWLGTSVEDQRAADERIPWLLQTPAAVRFLSCEPLIGRVDLDQWIRPVCPMHEEGGDVIECLHAGWDDGSRPKSRLGWVIAGGESGPKHRPWDLDWARLLRDQCQAAGVAFFCKQSSGPRHGMHRELDGRMWEEFPEPRQRETVPV